MIEAMKAAQAALADFLAEVRHRIDLALRAPSLFDRLVVAELNLEFWQRQAEGLSEANDSLFQQAQHFRQENEELTDWCYGRAPLIRVPMSVSVTDDERFMVHTIRIRPKTMGVSIPFMDSAAFPRALCQVTAKKAADLYRADIEAQLLAQFCPEGNEEDG